MLLRTGQAGPRLTCLRRSVNDSPLGEWIYQTAIAVLQQVDVALRPLLDVANAHLHAPLQRLGGHRAIDIDLDESLAQRGADEGIGMPLEILDRYDAALIWID